MTYFSITSKLIVEEAKKMGFDVEILKSDKNFYVINGNGKEVYFKSNDSGIDSSLGNKISNDKELTYIILNRKGYKIPRSLYIKKEDVYNFDINKTDLRFPLVTKPICECHGDGVTVKIESNDELIYGINEALKYGDSLIIQEYIQGEEHRIVVIGGKVVLGIKRVPAYVIGNGKNTIKELIELENKNPLRGVGYEKSLTYIEADNNLIRYISKSGLSLDSIPDISKYVQLRGVSNIGAGGVPIDVTSMLGESIKTDCEKIAELVGQKLLGIDIITNDLSKSLIESNGAILEINSNPGFGGEFVNEAYELLKYLFEVK